MSLSHYSPRTPLVLMNDLKMYNLLGKLNGIGILAFNKLIDSIPSDNQVVLSLTGNLEEAARNLYAAMHKLDSLKLDRIIAERVPNVGIGIAINDRLERASIK